MQRFSIKSTERGLTLIESLAAIVIFGLAVVAISPPIVMSMASRIRAYRAEQATKLAEGEIDRVRLLVDRISTSTNAADFIAKLPPDGGGGNAPTVGPPTTSANCANGVPATVTQACVVDLNGTTFVVQSFRTKTYTPNDIPLGFQMGVRVYTKASLDSGGLVTKPGSLAFSGRTTSGQSPLAVLYAPIVKSDLPASAAVYSHISNNP